MRHREQLAHVLAREGTLQRDALLDEPRGPLTAQRLLFGDDQPAARRGEVDRTQLRGVHKEEVARAAARHLGRDARAPVREDHGWLACVVHVMDGLAEQVRGGKAAEHVRVVDGAARLEEEEGVRLVDGGKYA